MGWGGEGRGGGSGERKRGLSEIGRCCIVQYTLQIPSYKPCAFSLLHPRQLWSEREPSLQPLEQLGEGRGGDGTGGEGRWQCQRKEKGK